MMHINGEPITTENFASQDRLGTLPSRYCEKIQMTAMMFIFNCIESRQYLQD